MKRMTVWLALAFACALLLTSPASSVSAENFSLTTVYFVRHAEKAADPANDPPLTEDGHTRAQNLARLFAAAGLKAIYTSQFLRTKHTAAPLAQTLGLPLTEIPVGMDTMTPNVISPQYLKDVTERIYANAGQSVLIVGHSNTIPALIKEFGGDIVPTIQDAEYGDLFVVTVYDKGKAKVAHLKQ